MTTKRVVTSKEDYFYDLRRLIREKDGSEYYIYTWQYQIDSCELLFGTTIVCSVGSIRYEEAIEKLIARVTIDGRKYKKRCNHAITAISWIEEKIRQNFKSRGVRGRVRVIFNRSTFKATK